MIQNSIATPTRPARQGFYLFTAVLSLYLFFSPAHFLTTPDEELNLRTTLSLLEGQRGAIPPLGGFASKRGIDGKEYAQYGLGLPLASSLWCQVGLWLDPSLEPSANSLQQADDTNLAGTVFLRGWMTIFAMILSALTVVLCHGIFLQLGFRKTGALLSAMLLAFGTYQWPHGRTFFTEPLAALCLAGAIWILLKSRRQNYPTKELLLAGILWAYAILTRVDSLVTLPAACWLLCVVEGRHRFSLRIDLKKMLVFAVPFITVFVLMALYNQYRFDSFFSTGYEDQAEKVRFITPLLVGVQGFLFTPGRSLFLYSPPLIFGVMGMLVLWKKDRHFSIGLILLCAGYMAAMSKWQNWAGGFDWGPRHIFQTTPFFMIFAAAYIQEAKWWDTPTKRIAAMLFITFSAGIQLLGLSGDPVEIIKTWLANPGPMFTGVQDIILLQFNIYLPQFSTPVLFWRWILANGPDLLIVRILPSTAWGIPGFGLLLVLFGFSVRKLVQGMKVGEEQIDVGRV